MHPFWRAMTFSSVLVSRCVCFMRDASTLILCHFMSWTVGRYGHGATYAPMSLTMTAIRRPCSLFKMR